MIDGATSKQFNAFIISLPAITQSYKEEVITYSQQQYARKVQEIETATTGHYPDDNRRQTILFEYIRFLNTKT